MCDKKNSVLFTETECLVLSLDFKLPDENQVLLKVPRHNNMYNFDLKNGVPSGGLTCLFAKATIDEANLWHRRLGHINFKTMNKLVRENLVKGLPFKIFENNHTCIACQKGKQHKPSCKTKLVSIISQPLQMLHMDLFGLTFVKNLNNKMYYLVVTNDFSRSPNIKFMKPFGCPVTILNTLDHLGKFEKKADEGFLVGYSINRRGPEWLFDIDSLTNSMDYELVTIGNQTNNDAGIEINANAGKAGQEKASDHEYILLLFMPLSIQSSDDKDVGDVLDKGDKGVSKGSGTDDQEKTDSNTQDVGTAKPSINTASTNINTSNLNINFVGSNDLSMPSLEETGIFDDVYDDREVGVEADTNNLELSTVVSPIPTIREHKDHPKEQIIGDLNLATQTRRMLNFSKENVMVSYINKQRRTNHKDYQNCLFACFFSQQEPKKVVHALADPSWIEAMQEELLQFKLQKVWTLVDPPNNKRAIGTKWVFRNKKDERGIVIRNKASLVAQGYTQEEGINYDEVFAPVARIDAIRIFLAYASFMGFIVYHMDVKSAFVYGTIKDEIASTPMEPNKTLIKDVEAEDVDVHLYRSMIISLMYLTTSKPDIMFAVCACARFQVTPKTSHLHVVKRIFRYLKGQPKLGLWYPKDSPFDLEAFFDSDYVGASLDRKSTTEYVVAASCGGQVLWIQNQMLDYGFNLMNSKIYIDNESTICIVKNPVFHSETKHIEITYHFINDSYEKKLIQVIKIHTDHNVKTVNDDVQIQSLVDGKKVIVNEASIKRDLRLNDTERNACLPTAVIFEELARMRCEKTSQKLTFSPEEVGDILTYTQDTPILTQPSTSQPQKKHKLKRKQRKETEVSQDEPPTEKHIPTPSYNPLPSGEDILQLNELMEICTKLSDRDLSLEKTKTNQAAEIETLKKRVKKLEGKKKKRTHGLKRLYKISLSARIVCSDEEDLFGVHDLDGDEVFMDVTTGENVEQDATVAEKVVTTIKDIEVTIAAATTLQISKDELTLAQALMEIKTAKPKTKGLTIQEPKIMEESLKKTQAEVTKGSSKRAREELDQESTKKQKLDKQVQAKVVDDGTTQLKRCLEIVPKDDDDVIIEATPLSSESPVIVDYKIYKEGKKSYFRIIKIDGNSQNYLTFRTMFKNFNREDLEVLRSIVKERFKKTKQVGDMDNLLFQTLKTMIEHHVEDIIWKYQQGAVKVNN
nr:ribonuclease H-like domain, reverse transcriptase, RNA-dependent DNA polymerase [Tanacetum cinerariifolium]